MSQLPLGPTYGAIFIGAFLSAVLFGVTNIQALIYLQRFPADSTWNKLAVCVLWVLDATHLALCVHMIYFYLVTNYGDPEALLKIVWSFKAQIIVDAVVVMMVHTLYTVRLWKLTAIDHQLTPLSTRRGADPRLTPNSDTVAPLDGGRPLVRRILPAFVTGIVILGYGASAVLCYEINKLEYWMQLLDAQWVTYFALGAASGIDVVIASSLCYLLARCRTGSQKMDSTITVLMMYTLNTGMITSMCSLTAIVMMAAFPTSFIMIAIEFSLTKLYVNSFMAMFNARSNLRDPETQHSAHDVDLGPLQLSPSATDTAVEYKKFSYTPSPTMSRTDPRTPRTSTAPLEADLARGLPLYWPAPDAPGRDTPANVHGRARSAASPPSSPRSWRKPPPEVDAVSCAEARGPRSVHGRCWGAEEAQRDARSVRMSGAGSVDTFAL